MAEDVFISANLYLGIWVIIILHALNAHELIVLIVEKPNRLILVINTDESLSCQIIGSRTLQLGLKLLHFCLHLINLVFNPDRLKEQRLDLFLGLDNVGIEKLNEVANWALDFNEYLAKVFSGDHGLGASHAELMEAVQGY